MSGQNTTTPILRSLTEFKTGWSFHIHTIGSQKPRHNVDPWINKYIFPNVCLPSVRQIAEASESHFVMEDWRQLWRFDYDTTLMAWHERFINAARICGQLWQRRFKAYVQLLSQRLRGCVFARDVAGG